MPVYQTDILKAIELSGAEVFQAMPWLEIQEPLPNQVLEYLRDVGHYGAGGLLSLGNILSGTICRFDCP